MSDRHEHWNRRTDIVTSACAALVVAGCLAAAHAATGEPATPDAIADLTFNDPAFAACVKKHADKNQWSSAGDVVELVCHSAGIRSVEGLEAFANLKRASFFRNRIKQFSVGELPALEHLNLAQNELESFSIGSAGSLQELYLFRNQLKKFSAAGLTELAKLRISENHLVHIELSGLPKLSRAYVHDNKLETIDLSKNLPSLKFVDLRINPLPDPVYDVLDAMKGVTIPHDGNAEDWE